MVDIELVFLPACRFNDLTPSGQFLYPAQECIRTWHAAAGDVCQRVVQVAMNVFGNIAAGKENGKPATDYISILIAGQITYTQSIVD
jgi:hypothetical protein